MKLKGKFWGPRRAVELFKKYLDAEYIALTSPVKPSSQGDFHAYFTIEVNDK